MNAYATGTSPTYPGSYTQTVYLADNSVGDHSTYVPPASSSDVWAVAYLGAVVLLDRIRCSMYSAGDGTWTIKTSTDGSTWTNFASGSITGSTWLDYDSGSVTAINAMYVQVHVIDSGTISGGGGPLGGP